MSYTLNLMPEESINGLFIRDSIVNDNRQAIRNKEIWANGFLKNLRLFTNISGTFSDRYLGQLQNIDSLTLNNEHTLNSLFHPLTKNQINLYDGAIEHESRDICLSEIKSVPVLFCTKCYKEQIEYHGFFWLKTSWQNPCCVYCFEHNQHLVSAVPLLKAQYYSSDSSYQYSSLKIKNWLKICDVQEIKCDDEISLYRWFDSLRKAQLPYLNDEQLQEIMEFVYYYIYGKDKDNSFEISKKLWEAFDNYTAVDIQDVGSKRKWFFHGNHNRHRVDGVVRIWPGERISTAQFWTIVYLGFKDFEFFYKECGDIFLP